MPGSVSKKGGPMSISILEFKQVRWYTAEHHVFVFFLPLLFIDCNLPATASNSKVGIYARVTSYYTELCKISLRCQWCRIVNLSNGRQWSSRRKYERANGLPGHVVEYGGVAVAKP